MLSWPESRKARRWLRLPWSNRPRESAMDFDKRRFKALVLYIAHRRRNDPRFGRTKLAKALFYSDFAVYQAERQPLTGATYIRMPFGPFPRELGIAEVELHADGFVTRDYLKNQYEEKRLLPRGQLPRDLEAVFEDWQLLLVNDWTDRVASASATQISDLSHRHLGWRLAAQEGAVIPYETALIPQERPTAHQGEEAKKIARERGWLSPDGEWQWEQSAT